MTRTLPTPTTLALSVFACAAFALAAPARATEPQKKIAVLEFELQLGAEEKVDRVYFSNSVRTLVEQRLPSYFMMTRANTEELLAVQGKSLADCESGCEVTSWTRPMSLRAKASTLSRCIVSTSIR